jgi:hypothetical protein
MAGYRLKLIRCPRCGKETEPRKVYCTHCGALVVEPHWSEGLDAGLMMYGGWVGMLIASFVFVYGIFKVWSYVEEAEAHTRNVHSFDLTTLLIVGGAAVGSLLLLFVANKLPRR